MALTFGIELEMASPLRHSQVADALNAAGLNIPAIPASYSGRDYTKWQVKDDVTIPTNGRLPWKVEVVSPVLTWDDPRHLEDLATVTRVLNEIGARVLRPQSARRTAGLHVHMEMASIGQDALARWGRIWSSRQNVTDTLVRSGRERGGRYSEWCAVLSGSAWDRFVTAAQSGDARALTGVASSHGYAVNTQWFLERGTLEVRQRDGSINFRKIMGLVGYIRATRLHAESNATYRTTNGDYLSWLVDMGFLSEDHRRWAERRGTGSPAPSAPAPTDPVAPATTDRLARLRSLQRV